ncbi:hypothetical protein Hanom_Chr09g00770361 [Helianthus anomalus]
MSLPLGKTVRKHLFIRVKIPDFAYNSSSNIHSTCLTYSPTQKQAICKSNSLSLGCGKESKLFRSTPWILQSIFPLNEFSEFILLLQIPVM